MIAAASSRFLLHAPPTPTCLRGSPPSTIDFFVATGECYPVDVIPGNFSDHHPITATCYLDDLPPLREMVSRVAWRPSMPVCWSRVTQDDRKKFVLNAAHRFQRHPPASAECAADWFTKQLLRCGAHLPKQAPGTRRSSTTAFRHARAEALAAVQAVDSLAPETPPEIREAAIAYVTRKVKEYRSALVGTAGKKERLHDPVTAWKLYRRCQDEARQSVPREVQFPAEAEEAHSGCVAERFTALYASKSDIPAGVLPAVMPALPENVDIPEVSEAELQMAFRATPRGKAADFFGLTVELLALLPPVARAAMRAVFTRVLKQGLPSTWRRSVITPVCKPGKDPPQRRVLSPGSDHLAPLPDDGTRGPP
eukprot:gene9921-biopygen6819